MGELSTTSSSVMQIKFFPKDFGYHKMSFELCEFLPVSFSLLNPCRFSLFPLRVYIFLPKRRTLKRKWINHEPSKLYNLSFCSGAVLDHWPSPLAGKEKSCLVTALPFTTSSTESPNSVLGEMYQWTYREFKMSFTCGFEGGFLTLSGAHVT